MRNLRRSTGWLWMLFALTVPLCVSSASAQTGQFVDRVYADGAGDHKYVVFVPRGYDPAREWPVILYLHSAGERGTDGRRPIETGLAPFVKERAGSFPFFVVFPQAGDEQGRRLTGWSADSTDGKRAIAILDAVEQEFSIDKSRQVLTGWSMGGYGTWSIAAALPERFSALVPLAGGGQETWAARLKAVPIWAWHGAKDTAVFPAEAQRMVDAVTGAGGRAYLTEVPNVGHDIWRAAYGHDDLYRWMLDPSQAPATTVTAVATDLPVDSEPFVPALTIPAAVHVRLGNEMLQALSYSIPARVPNSALQGSINNIYDTTTASGRTFRVTLAGITYEAQLVRAALKAYRRDRLNVQLALRNVVLTIRSSSMVGSGRSAVTGPIYVVIGNRRPVWLSIDVTPYVADGKLRLRLAATNFQIPNDNWYVTPPYGVRTSGFGMTRERVSSGLVSGLYGSKSRIEREVVAAVPAMLRELEENLDLTPVNDVVGSFWPLPVYRPRLRVQPQSVSTDENGVSLVMGITAAAIDPQQAPAQPRVVTLAGGANGTPADASPKLRVGLNPGVLGPLTDLLREADVARIHVLDIPENTFADFADRNLLAAAVPDLKGLGEDVEIWPELGLQSTVRVSAATPPAAPTAPPADNSNATENFSDANDGEENTDSTAEAEANSGKAEQSPDTQPTSLRFEIPRAVISVAVRKTPNADWTPYLDFEFSIAQTAAARVRESTFTTRALRLDWTGEPQLDVSARFAEGYQPDDATIDTNVLREMLSRSWQAWTTVGPVADVALSDVDLGSSKMRADDLGWLGSALCMSFDAAGIRITNDSQQPLKYETKGPYSGWGGPYTLPPGDFHQFNVPYPLGFRQPTESGYVRFTLPAGSHSEYRSLAAEGPPRLFQAREQPLDAQSEPDDPISTTQESGRAAAGAR